MKYEIIPIKQYKNNIKNKLVYCGKLENVLAMLKLDLILAKLNQTIFQGEQKPLLKTYLEKTKIF